MWFLVLFVLGGIYLALAFLVTAKARTHARKALALLVFALIPTADAVYGRIKLKHLCVTEGGWKIYRVVEGVEGFLEAGRTPSEFWVTKAGYRFVEGETLGRKPARLEAIPDGKAALLTDMPLQARYVFETKIGELKDIYRIKEINTNEVLSQFVNITAVGGWVEQLIAAPYGGAFIEHCSGNIRIDEFVTKTLIPIDKPAR